MKFISFDEYFNFHIQNHHTGYFRYIKYNQLAKSYAQHFGQENVNILLFEEMVKAPQEFCQKLGNFLGINSDDLFELFNKGPKQRKSDSSGQHAYSRLRSYLPVQTFKKYIPFSEQLIGFLSAQLKKSPKANISLNEDQLSSLERLYAKGNKKLSLEYNLDLSKYGYLECKD
ncbi:MAG: hypothetical protein MRY79_00065 [Alphaproteobacteria bacterium]|nr:hypothetical protein [Alphaproteobacteria bacterium]